MINKRSFLLGIGSGLIFSCLVFFLVYSFDFKTSVEQKVTENQISDAEILLRAKKLGMVTIKESFEKEKEIKKENTITENIKPESNIKEENTNNILEEDKEVVKNDLSSNIVQVENLEEVISFQIEKGSTSLTISKILQEKGLIDNAEEFNQFVINNGASKKLIYGEVSFKKNMNFSDILKTLITKNNAE